MHAEIMMIYALYIIICLTGLCFAIPSEFMRTPMAIDAMPSNDTKILMLKVANRLCRTANLCNSSWTNETLGIDKFTASCCQDCACDGSCGIRGDCCFPSAEDTSLEIDRRKYQDCLMPTTKHINPSENYKHRSYYLTTMCPEGKGVPDLNDREDCGNIPVAPWGSMYPLYSSSTGRLYKNHECADCHGIHDGILSMAFLYCKSGTANVADFFDWINKKSLPKYCHIRFKFQQSLKTERCFINVTDTCSGTEVVIPDWFEITSLQIIDACHDGIAAPFQKYNAYSNVFCFLCNGGRYDEYCFDFETYDDYVVDIASIELLLEDKTLKTRLDTDAERHQPVACMKPDGESQDACVPIHCPTGQIYNKKFECVHLSSFWNIPLYYVSLRLKVASAKLKESTLVAVIQDKADINSLILSPWPKVWSVNTMYYETGSRENTTSFVESFLVIIQMRANIKHKSVLRQIHRHANEDWTLNLAASSVVLSADFLKHSYSITSKNQRVIFAPMWYIRGLKLPQRYGVDLFREQSVQPIRLGGLIVNYGEITKMHLCMQISLETNSSHYELLADKYLLYFNGKVYYDLEFEILHKDDASVEPRICLLDSPFTEMPMETSGSAPVAVGMASFILLMLLFCPYI